MQALTDFPYIMNFRWWRNGKLFQRQIGFFSLQNAKEQAGNVASVCAQNKCDWLSEIFPYLGEPVVTGSAFGLKHHKTLF